MKQFAGRMHFENISELNEYLENMSRDGHKLITAIPVGDRPTMMGDFTLLMIWRNDVIPSNADLRSGRLSWTDTVRD